MRSTRRSRLSPLVVMGLAVAWALVTGGAAASSAEAKGHAGSGAVFTMTNSAMGNAVLAFRRSAQGHLTFLDTYDTGGTGTGSGLGNQGGVVLDRSGRRLLVVNAGSDSVSVFGVEPDGLTLLDVAPSGGTLPISVTIHRDLVYVLNAGGDGNIAGLRLAKNGTLSPLVGSMQPLSGSGTAPAQIAFSPSGRVLVVTEKGTNSLVTYAVGHDGLPGSPIVTPSEGMTPFGFSFGHHDRLFVSEAFGGAPQASAVSSYDVSDDGMLHPITSSLPTHQTAACWLVVTRNGRYAYTTNTGSDSVTGLALAPSGAASLLDADGFTAQAGGTPIDAALSRNGRFLYVLNGGDGSLSAYRVSADGSLTPLPGVNGLPSGTNGLAAE
jgi:6-phosphogluconolactonase